MIRWRTGQQARASIRPYEWARIGRRTMSFYGDVLAEYDDRSLDLAGAG